MPVAPALLAAIAIVGSTSPGNVTAANSTSWFRTLGNGRACGFPHARWVFPKCYVAGHVCVFRRVDDCWDAVVSTSRGESPA